MYLRYLKKRADTYFVSVFCVYMVEIIAIITLSVLNIIQFVVNYKSRADLLDRVMSKDYAEFKAYESPAEENTILDEEDDLIPLTEMNLEDMQDAS